MELIMKQKVLVIDCHPVYKDKIIGFLQDVGFEHIYLAQTGEEGLTMKESINPDLVLLSGMLPDMDSLDVCQTIHQSQKKPLKIIVQTGLFTEQERIEQFKLNGAHEVLLRKEKDFTPLRNAVDSALTSVAV